MTTSNTTFTFEKSLFSLYLNSWGVDKYTSDDGQVKLVNTHAINGDSEETITFESDEAYENWVKKYVTDDEWYYNKANGLNKILDAIEQHCKSARYEFDSANPDAWLMQL